jgi:phosphate transport system substrate-binding protein
MEAARRRPEVPIAANDQDNAEMAEAVPGSLVGISLAQLVLEKRNLRPIVVDGLEPTFANFERGAYPHAKLLYFVVRGQPRPPLEAFLAFLRSPEGTAVFRAAHLL